MNYATPSEYALVSWREVKRQGEFVLCRRGTGESGWWHDHGDGDYGGNPMDWCSQRDRLECRTCGKASITTLRR